MEDGKSIKALMVVIRGKGEVDMIQEHNYAFSYSKTGSVKYTGIYKPKYFKKENLNSYEYIGIGKRGFFLFTEDFGIDTSECVKIVLKYLISNNEIVIIESKKRIELYKSQLNKAL